MIKINILDINKQRLNKAVFEALEAIRNRSFSGRNPQLGKMINCHVCSTRHRSYPACIIKYAKGSRYDMLPESEKKEMVIEPTTIKQLVGARQFARKREHPHPSKRGLQLVQRVQKLFPFNEPYLSDPKECMKESRKQAIRELKAEHRLVRRAIRRQTQISRRINAGLAKPGARP